MKLGTARADLIFICFKSGGVCASLSFPGRSLNFLGERSSCFDRFPGDGG